MKKVISFLFILVITVSCSSPSSTTLTEHNFPLALEHTITIDGIIEEVAVLDTWIGVATSDKIIGIDLDTQKPLWDISFSVITYSEPAFRVVGDTLVAASGNQLILLDRAGTVKEINLLAGGRTIIYFSGAYSDYVYVIRGTNWMLEAYDSAENKMLWRTTVDRGGRDAYYDKSTGMVFVPTSNNSILAIDNSTGELLWTKSGSVLRSTFAEEVLYIFEKKDSRGSYRIAALDVRDQQNLWGKDIELAPTRTVEFLSSTNSLLIACTGAGLIGLDKSSGEQLWYILDEEGFNTAPVQLADMLFVRGSSRKVYAVVPSDGSVLGWVELKNSTPFQKDYEIYAGVHELDDGILFYAENKIYIYRIR